MSHSFTFKVEVELERESGKFASRDEMSEILEEALQGAMEDVDISSIGPDSESAYEINDIFVEELEKKELKKLNSDYDAAVLAAKTPKTEEEKQLKALKENARKDASIISQMHEEIRELRLAASLAKEPTRVWVNDYRRDASQYVYIPDKEAIRFSVGEYEHIDVKIKEGELELYGSRSFSLRLSSGNVVYVRMDDI